MQKHLRTITKPLCAKDDLSDFIALLNTLILPILSALDAFMQVWTEKQQG